MSGFPMPELYNQHYINKYSFPKGLMAQRKTDDRNKKQKVSIYDMHTAPVRKGISGWKLTKRAVAAPVTQPSPNQSRNMKNLNGRLNNSSNIQFQPNRYKNQLNVRSNDLLLDTHEMKAYNSAAGP